MMRHVRERVPQRFAREYGLPPELVDFFIPLLRRHAVELPRAVVEGFVQKPDPVSRSAPICIISRPKLISSGCGLKSYPSAGIASATESVNSFATRQCLDG